MIFVGIAAGEQNGVEIISIKTKTQKERLVNLFTQEIGGTASYWNKIPVTTVVPSATSQSAITTAILTTNTPVAIILGLPGT